jgi:hypothetical protein
LKSSGTKFHGVELYKLAKEGHIKLPEKPVKDDKPFFNFIITV